MLSTFPTMSFRLPMLPRVVGSRSAITILLLVDWIRFQLEIKGWKYVYVFVCMIFNAFNIQLDIIVKAMNKGHYMIQGI